MAELPEIRTDVLDDLQTLQSIEAALRRKKQVILYGPPGTGKTHAARNAAVWFLEGGTDSGPAQAALADRRLFLERESELSSGSGTAPQTWLMVANPNRWSWSNLIENGPQGFTFGKIQANYPEARVGDLVVGYEATPTKRIVALARVVGEFDSEHPDGSLKLEPISEVVDGPTYDDLTNDPIVGGSEPMRHRCQGTLFGLTSSESERLLQMITESDPSVSIGHRSKQARLTRVTFHPSFTYEDFVEGFRPVPGEGDSLRLELVDGVFKKACRAAAAEPDSPFILLIDEINRGNIPKILGELITLIESDKRGLTVNLAQSGEEFTVPPNLHIIGTMNTADRSIQLLDAALRRRFAFVELLPDSSALDGVSILGLDLGIFLDDLNERIRAMVGRERQIGHALFFHEGAVISTPDAFASVFRFELLPLLQEYLHEDYSLLADVLGDVIDRESERVSSIADDPEGLLAALVSRSSSAAAAT